MRLGTFWGLTAPMLLLAYDDIDALVDHVNFMRNATNGNIINDLHSELNFLLQSSQLQEIEISTPDGGFFSDREPDAFVSNGSISNSQDPQEVAFSEIRNEIVLKLAQKIVSGEQKGKYIVCNGAITDFLDGAANELMKTSEFYSSEINRVVTKFYRSVVSENGSSVSDAIKESFACSTRLPEKLLRNGIPIEISSDLTKIYQYFQNRISDVQILFDNTVATTAAEVKIFNIELSSFVQKPPNYLEFVSSSLFDYATKSKSAAILLQSVEDYKLNLDALIDAVNSLIVATEEQDTAESVDYSKYEVASHLQHPEDYTAEELRHIEDLYEHVMDLTPEKVAAKLEISESSLEECYKPACNVGICGLNGQTKALFLDSLDNVIMSDSFIWKSRDYLEKLQISIENAKHLLRNIKPLGAEI